MDAGGDFNQYFRPYQMIFQLYTNGLMIGKRGVLYMGEKWARMWQSRRIMAGHISKSKRIHGYGVSEACLRVFVDDQVVRGDPGKWRMG